MATKLIPKYVIIFTSLISLLLSAACNSELLPKALATETQNIVEQVKADNDDVFGEIQRNIDLVTTLKAKVQEAQLNNETVSLNSVIKDVEKVATSYENLAGQRGDIRKQILQKVAEVEKMQTTVDVEIKILREKRADYTNQLRLVNDPNPDIARTRREALNRAIEYVDAQIQLWKDFSSIERDIILEMSEVQKTIDSFLAMIESTAIVFREGLNLLYLQRDINEALALFSSDIPRMEQLTRDMNLSWSNLDFLLHSLTNISSMQIAPNR